MNIVAKSAAMVFCALLVSAGSVDMAAWADSGNFRNYGRVGLGFNHFEGDLDDADYETGININATYGRYLANNLVIEGTVDYFYSHQEDINGSTGLPLQKTIVQNGRRQSVR